jgi:hypothetical protein
LYHGVKHVFKGDRPASKDHVYIPPENIDGQPSSSILNISYYFLKKPQEP